ncbi:hypothetical protein [Winogradskyella thalassocola]|uniref:Uncharacterized protein n=1 Tax=Winogradskyella thalassocola TaxID=262004 RepID=A0A1G8KMX8_9FLAO|nr:hypothetical protein [Winogradskyella thalassocola]SDI44795.1 hypothetical protein SAMN04489796_11157 [Winogradskyella thalassocola]
MKNFGLLILGIILGALAMYFYCCNDVNKMDSSPTKPPSGIISPTKIKELSQAYNERYRIINDSLFKNTKAEDNRSTWYKLEDIENYLTYAKKQANDNSHVMDGLRLYLGAYPDANGEKGLTTLFFVPTGYENISEGSFFSLQDEGGNDLTNSDGLNLGTHGKPPRANYPQ